MAGEDFMRIAKGNPPIVLRLTIGEVVTDFTFTEVAEGLGGVWCEHGSNYGRFSGLVNTLDVFVTHFDGDQIQEDKQNARKDPNEVDLTRNVLFDPKSEKHEFEVHADCGNKNKKFAHGWLSIAEGRNFLLDDSLKIRCEDDHLSIIMHLVQVEPFFQDRVCRQDFISEDMLFDSSGEITGIRQESQRNRVPLHFDQDSVDILLGDIFHRTPSKNIAAPRMRSV